MREMGIILFTVCIQFSLFAYVHVLILSKVGCDSCQGLNAQQAPLSYTVLYC